MAIRTPSSIGPITAGWNQDVSGLKMSVLSFTTVSNNLDTYVDANLINVSVSKWAVAQPNSVSDYVQVANYAPTTGTFTFLLSGGTPAFDLIIWTSN